MTKKIIRKVSPELNRLRAENRDINDSNRRLAREREDGVTTISKLTAVVRDLQNKLSVADTNCRDLDSRLVRSEAERNGYIKQLQEWEFDENRVPDLERQLKAAQDRAAAAFLGASKPSEELQRKHDALEEIVRRLENLVVRLAVEMGGRNGY